MTDLAKQYQRKTDKEHILDNPDTYIGSVETVDASMWVHDNTSSKIILKNIEYVPGLYKLFDEGIVNCRDHVVRMINSPVLDKKMVTHISVTVGEDGTIVMENDGNGIDVAKHPEYGIWIPEMIFGHLRTSTNYDKTEKRIVGGKNGFGFKLVLIWSTYGKVETVDHRRGLMYVQEFKDNLDTICPPVITKTKSLKPYTRITFKPDYARFGMPNGITSDMFALLKKRTYDIAAVTDHSAKKVKVHYNGDLAPVKNFQQYIDMYIGEKTGGAGNGARVYEAHGERWEYAVALSPTHEFTAVSFVNGICTFKGGKHVDYIIGQITRKLVAYIEKKKKITVNQNSIKEQLILFVRCDIENPAFDSQTKDFMNTPSSKFGSTCTVSDGFIEKVAKMGVMDVACSLMAAKQNKEVAKKTDGSKTRSIRGIPNLIDANWSGTAKSKECVLILCEGLSALSGIVSGLSSEDRNTIGIYPLKGKLLNVRGEAIAKVAENKEITELKKILGLENDKEYATIDDISSNLRYSKIMILCDQDTDGSHIKGLCINLFHSEWASLVRIPGFLSFMNTPILRAKKASQVKVFYNEGEYQSWKDEMGNNGNGWTIKYFKGLGTSTSSEFKEYFANKKVVDFVYNGPESDDVIDKIFNKKRANDRKTWLENYNKNSFLDTSRKSVKYEEFINDEMIHFSTYDCARSIPNMVDGLKISLRKILFAAFKRKLTSEIKVAQFSGYVSEHSAYHHGEASLNGAIVNMAQTFVGSNNINLLEPNGQFGTRLHGGGDSASERYIFTLLNKMTRSIFPEADDAVLTYLDDDGTLVEPEYYVPIVPFALMNGISGIGTGFSCNIPSYNPQQIINSLRAKLNKQEYTETFVPYYEGFKGIIGKVDDKKYLVKGKYETIGADKIRITELPIGTWTMPYTSFLEGLMDGSNKNGKKIPASIRDFTSVCTEVSVNFEVTFPRGKLDDLESKHDAATGINGIEKLLKLTTSIGITNMHMFDADLKLHKYGSIEEIIDDFYKVRIDVYGKRKAYLIDILDNKLVKLSNKARYIQETLDNIIDLRRKKAQVVTELLTERKFDIIDGDYKYLIKMPMDSVTEENVASIVKDKQNAVKELERLKKTTLENMWLSELDTLEKEYTTYKNYREKVQNGAGSTKSKVLKAKVKKNAKK
jgi:DNA topoisomerase-2